MKNDLFSIGPFTVHGYGLMIAIGVLSAYYMVEYRAKKKQMDWEKVFPLTVWSVLGGFLGSKILYLLTRLPDTHQFDALVMVPNCDKNVPGLLMAAARINVPTVFVCIA